jgi:hypothetical protein
MVPNQLSHTEIPQKPNAKHGELDYATGVHLEAEGAKNTLSPFSPYKAAALTKLFEGKPLFHNGWFCKQCDCVTEHRNVQGREVCLECGFALGKPKPVVAAQKRDYRAKNKDRLAAQKRDYRAKNKDRLAAQKRDYRAKNKDRLNTYQREWKRRRIEKKVTALKMEASR